MSTAGPFTIDITSIVRSWVAADPSLDESIAQGVVRTLLGPDEVAAAVDPETPVTLPSLRILRAIVLPALGRSSPEASLAVLDRIDELFASIAERGVARLEALTLVDPLTGLGNRRAAEVDLRRAIAHGDRHARPVTVAVLDLDGLKRVNDELGHEAGDECLRQFADSLRATARLDDGLYRPGGDEFLVIAPNTTAADVRGLIERLHGAAPPFSAGVASAPADATDPAALIAVADQRLYEHKRVSPGRVVLPAPLGDRPTRRHLVELAPLVIGPPAAEIVRRLLGVDLVGGRTMVWLGLLVAAPIATLALEAAARPRPWRPRPTLVVRRIAALLLVLVAALVPIAAFP